MPQFSSLGGWRTSGNSSYNALNFTFWKGLRSGIQFDVNYTTLTQPRVIQFMLRYTF